MSTTKAYHIATIDILRGFALAGILFANILALGGYRDAPAEIQAYFASGIVNQSILFLNDVLLRYKFYTLFSFLFGVGFSILLARATDHKKFISSYLMRLTILFIIGWLHALLFLDGDILRIYAIAGCFLLLFKDMSNQNLLISSLILFSIPLLIGVFESFNFLHVDPGQYFTYSSENTMTAFQQGPWSAFVSSNFERTLNYLANNLTSRRFFKILGLFLLGFYAGRLMVFHRLKEYMNEIKRILPWAWGFSLTTNILYTLLSTKMDPIMMELFYILSVYPLSFTYIITVVYLCRQEGKITSAMATVGRMSLTNFLAQSVLAGFFMLWFGLGLAVQLQVFEYYLIATVILISLFIFSHYWLKYFSQGPIEYGIRRCL